MWMEHEAFALWKRVHRLNAPILRHPIQIKSVLAWIAAVGVVPEFPAYNEPLLGHAVALLDARNIDLAFKSWSKYHHSKHVQNRLLELADMYFNSRALRKAIRLLYRQLYRKDTYHKSEILIFNRDTKRKYSAIKSLTANVANFKLYHIVDTIAVNGAKRKALRMFEENAWRRKKSRRFYSFLASRSQRKIYRCWLSYKIRARTYKWQAEIADSQLRKTMFRKWGRFVRIRKTHSRLLCLENVFGLWYRCFCDSIKLTNCHCEIARLKKYWRLWHQFSNVQKMTLNKVAHEVRSRAASKYYRLWRRRYLENAMKRVAHKERVQRRIFEAWKHFLRVSLLHFRYLAKKRTAIRSLRHFSCKSKSAKQNTRLIVEKHQRFQTASIFNQWMKLRRSLQFYRKRTISTYFDSWCIAINRGLALSLINKRIAWKKLYDRGVELSQFQTQLASKKKQIHDRLNCFLAGQRNTMVSHVFFNLRKIVFSNRKMRMAVVVLNRLKMQFAWTQLKRSASMKICEKNHQMEIMKKWKYLHHLSSYSKIHQRKRELNLMSVRYERYRALLFGVSTLKRNSKRRIAIAQFEIKVNTRKHRAAWQVFKRRINIRIRSSVFQSQNRSQLLHKFFQRWYSFKESKREYKEIMDTLKKRKMISALAKLSTYKRMPNETMTQAILFSKRRLFQIFVARLCKTRRSEEYDLAIFEFSIDWRLRSKRRALERLRANAALGLNLKYVRTENIIRRSFLHRWHSVYSDKCQERKSTEKWIPVLLNHWKLFWQKRKELRTRNILEEVWGLWRKVVLRNIKTREKLVARLLQMLPPKSEFSHNNVPLSSAKKHERHVVVSIFLILQLRRGLIYLKRNTRTSNGLRRLQLVHQCLLKQRAVDYLVVNVFGNKATNCIRRRMLGGYMAAWKIGVLRNRLFKLYLNLYFARWARRDATIKRISVFGKRIRMFQLEARFTHWLKQLAIIQLHSKSMWFHRWVTYAESIQAQKMHVFSLWRDFVNDSKSSRLIQLEEFKIKESFFHKWKRMQGLQTLLLRNLRRYLLRTTFENLRRHMFERNLLQKHLLCWSVFVHHMNTRRCELVKYNEAYAASERLFASHAKKALLNAFHIWSIQVLTNRTLLRDAFDSWSTFLDNIHHTFIAEMYMTSIQRRMFYTWKQTIIENKFYTESQLRIFHLQLHARILANTFEQWDSWIKNQSRIRHLETIASTHRASIVTSRVFARLHALSQSSKETIPVDKAILLHINSLHK